MMGLGSVGEGSGANSSSSISNLSPLAPPFTVDTLNLNPLLSSNCGLNYSEMSYAVEPFSHTSNFASPSAPRHELDIHSTETRSMSLNDYQSSDSLYLGPSGVRWSDSAFVYGGGVKTYYSPSVPPMIGEGSSINEYDGQSTNTMSPSGLPVSSQLGYTQSLFDLEYGPRWIDNVGFSDSKGVKTLGVGGDFSSENVNVGGSHSYKIQVSQGIFDIPFMQKFQEVPGVPCGNWNRVSDDEVHSGQFAPGNLEDKQFLKQNADLVPYDCTETSNLVSSSIFPESYYIGQSCDMHQNVSNFQNLCGPYEKCVLPIDPSFPSSVSVMRSSSAAIIRPHPAVNDFLGKDVASYRTTHNENVTVVDFEQCDPSKRKGSSQIPSYYLQEDFLLPATGKELTSPMQSNNNFPSKFKERVGSQLPHINVSSGFSTSHDSKQAVYSAVGSSNFVDHQNRSVDSPCWKGAPSSLFSAFDVVSSDSLKKNLDQCYGFGLKEHQNLSMCDSTRDFSNHGGEGNNNDYHGCGRNSVYSLESTLYTNSMNREQNLSDGAKAFVGTSTMISGEGIQMSNQPNFLNESGQSRNSESSFDVRLSDTKHLNVEEDAGLTLNDVSEGGSVAVCAAEKVLASPSSQETGYECAKPLPDTKFDTQTIIKAMHYLSDLLLCHLSHDPCYALEEEIMEIIKSIISNLNACMRDYIDRETDKPKLKKFVQDTLAIIKESQCVDKISVMPCMTNEAFNSHVQPDNRHMREEERNDSPVFSASRGVVDIKRSDDMTKAIKKILEENFHCNKEISSQALLFKNLWLEAEANLCSISYKARFDQMKIEMGKLGANTLKESEDVAEMMSEIRSTPDPNTDSKLVSEARGVTSPSPALKNSFIFSTTGNANVDASIMARFKILKSRGVNSKSISLEKERKLEEEDSEHAGSVIERFNILKSREHNLTSTNIGKDQQPDQTTDYDDFQSVPMRPNVLKPREGSLTLFNKEKEPHPEMVNNEHAESVMARLNILKSRDACSRITVKEEQQPEMVDVEFSGKKNMAAVRNDQSEAEVLYVSPKPCQTGILSEHEFGSQLNGRGYQSPSELHFSVPEYAMVHSSGNRNTKNKFYSWPHGSSLSSDWEHVQKDDLAWRNLQ